MLWVLMPKSHVGKGWTCESGSISQFHVIMRDLSEDLVGNVLPLPFLFIAFFLSLRKCGHGYRFGIVSAGGQVVKCSY